MRTHTALAGLVLCAALLLTAGLGARVYNLPDIAIAPTASGNTELIVSDGTAQAAININIDFDPSVVTPGTPTAGSAATGFIVRSNVVGGNQLRIVVYHDPTATFAPGNGVVVSIPWTAVGAAGTFTDLDISTIAVSDDAGNSGANGAAGAPQGIGGRILIANPPSADSVVATAEDLTTWISIQGFPFPLNEGGTPPFMDHNDPTNPSDPTRGLGGVSTHILTTTQDGTRDGWSRFDSQPDPNSRVPFVANSVYLIRWTFQGTTDPGGVLPTFRLHVTDDAFNSLAEVLANPRSVAGLVSGGGPTTYDMMYEPSDLSANKANSAFAEFDDFYLDWDIVDFDASQWGAIELTNLEVLRFDKSAVDPLFQTRYAVTDFTDTGQFELKPSFASFPADPAFGTVPLADITYIPGVTSFTAGTGLADPDGAGPQPGYYQEVGMLDDTLSLQDGVVYREVVTATTPLTEPDPLVLPTIRMRIADEGSAMGALYQVLAAVNHVGRGPSVGSNRPATGNSATYANYLVYPEGADIQSLLDSSFNSIRGELALFDLDANVGGNIDFSNFQIQAAPRDLLIP